MIDSCLFPEWVAVGDMVNWCSNVKNLLCSIGERYQRLWDTQDTSSDSKAIASSSGMLHQLYVDNLMSDIQASGESK